MATYEPDLLSAFMSPLSTYATAQGLRMAIENQDLKPSPATTETWLEPVMLPGRTVPAGIGDNALNYRVGVFQIMVYAPKNTGAGAGLAVVEALVELFKRGTSLAYGSISGIRIQAAWRGPGLKGDDWYAVPVSVAWFAYTSN